MKMKLLAMAAVASLIGFAPVTTVQAQESAGSSVNPFSDCGIGAAIFPDNGVGATISNIIWDLGTTAVTSGLSSPETCSSSKKDVALIINSSYASLEAEAAVGEGQYLTAVADAMSCSAEARSPLYAEVRVRMGEAVAAPAYMDMDKTAKAAALYNIVEQTVATKFAGQCNLA